MSKFLAIACLILGCRGALGAEDFCDNPIEAICGKNGVDAIARAKRLKESLTAADRAALTAVKDEFPELKRDHLTKEEIAKVKDRKLRYAAMAVYEQTILERVQNRLGNAEAVASLHFERTRERLQKIIKENASINKSETDDMLANLKDAELVNAVDVLQGKKGSQALRDAVIESCNSDGLEENAFADVVSGKHYVIVCPGDLLGGFDFISRAERRQKPADNMLTNEVWTLGHETGHHADATDHPMVFKKMRQCLIKNHITELKKKDVDKYMAEISADHIGNGDLADFLKTRFKTRAERMTALKRSMISLCTTKDDGEHPSGKFRLEMLRRNPRIHEVMECKTPQQTSAAARTDATCTVMGEGEKVLWVAHPPRKNVEAPLSQVQAAQ